MMKNIPTYKAALLSVLITVLLVSTSSFLAPPEKQSGSEYIDLDTNPVGSDDSSNQAENPEPKNYIRIETDRDVYEKGENVNIRLVLVNTRNETVVYGFGDQHQWDIVIFDSQNNKIWKYPIFEVSLLMVSTITVLPYSEKRLSNWAFWENYEEIRVVFKDTESFENASLIVSKYNGTIVNKYSFTGRYVLVRVHENDTETFIEEIKKEDGIRDAIYNYNINEISFAAGTYTIRGTLFGYEINGEKTIQIK